MPIGSASSNQADDRAPMFSLARETGPSQFFKPTKRFFQLITSNKNSQIVIVVLNQIFKTQHIKPIDKPFGASIFNDLGSHPICVNSRSERSCCRHDQIIILSLNGTI